MQTGWSFKELGCEEDQRSQVVATGWRWEKFYKEAEIEDSGREGLTNGAGSPERTKDGIWDSLGK